jgi:YHS domain-containing protein
MEGLLWFLILGGLFYFMMRFGCGAHMVHGYGGHGGHTARDGHGEHAHLGGDDSGPVDPVCGMTVELGKAYGKMYMGTLYTFCSRDCLDKFEADPKKYLKMASSAGGGS